MAFKKRVPSKKKAARKATREYQQAQARKVGWRCPTCYTWHPSIGARDACPHTNILGVGA